MDIGTLTEFFGLMTLINLALLLLITALSIIAKDIIYAAVNWAHPMPREAFNTTNFLIMSLFKTLWGVFNLVPFVALLIIGSN